MPVIIPLLSTAHQSLDISLSAQLVTVQVDWEDISSAFYLTLTDINVGNIIVQNQRINTAVNVLLNQTLFSGNFAALSTTEPDQPFTIDNLNITHKFYFLSPEDLAGE